MEEHKLSILPPKHSGSKKKSDLHDHLLEAPFNAMLIAPTACGKSSVILNLLMNDNFYRKTFDKVYYFSPSVMIDKTLKAVAEDEDIVKIHEDEDLEKADDLLKIIVQGQKDLKEAGEDMPQILVVYDDMLQYLKSSSFIGSLFTKSRHYNISCIITSQNYRSVPLKARNNSQMVLVFKLYNDTEIQKLEEEIGCNFIDWLEYYKYATKDRYSFLYCDLRNMRLFKTFCDLLWSKALDY
jgi:hypothetical protein